MDELLKTAIIAAEEAGKKILECAHSTAFVQKSDGSPVTVADQAAHDTIVPLLLQTGIPILSEESEGVSLPYPRRIWIVDPLDGTRDFINKTNDYAVMIGLVEDGGPVLGVVYAPALHTLYCATKGAGAYVIQNGVTKQLQVSQKTESLRFVCSVNHFSPDMERVAKHLHATLLRRGSFGIKAGLIGEDDADFTFTLGKIGEWDICAPQIIVTEAGGSVTDRFGNTLIYGSSPDHRIQQGVICSNGVSHPDIVQALREAKQ